MKAAVVNGIGDIRVCPVETPGIKDGAILIKVQACAVCGSDIRIFRSGNPRVKYPAIIGHEIAGDVVAVGAGVGGFKPGDRVAVGADVPCGQCDWCRRGMGNCCDDNYAMGYQFPGGYAEYCLLEPMVVRHGPVVKLPSDVGYDEAALAEPLACCLNGFERAFMEKGKSVLVIGGGPIGLLLGALAKQMGAAMAVIAEKDGKRLARANTFAPDAVIDTAGRDLKGEINALTSGRGMDIVMVACADPGAQEQALGAAAKRGIVNFFGGLPGNARKIAVGSNLIHYREIYITGSHGSVPRQHQQALELIAEKKIAAEKLISHRFPLENISAAFEVVEKGEGLKVVVNP